MSQNEVLEGWQCGFSQRSTAFVTELSVNWANIASKKARTEIKQVITGLN